MKQSQVKPGVRALLSLGGRRGAVAVTVVCRWTPERAGDVRWCVRDSSGVERTVTPRQLRPLPAPIDIRDVVITTDDRAMVVTPEQHARIQALLASFERSRNPLDSLSERDEAELNCP